METKIKVVIAAAIALLVITIIIVSVLFGVVFQKSCNDVAQKYGIVGFETWGTAESNDKVKKWWTDNKCKTPKSDDTKKRLAIF